MADLSRHHPGRALLDSKNSPFAKAVQSLDVARLREILDLGQDANTRIGSKTALYALCSTRLSVESVSEPPLDGPGEESQLYCKPAGDPVRAGANRLDDFHRTKQRAACVAALLEAGADPNLRPWGSDPDTPLIEAALHGFPDIVRLLLAHGADVGFTQKHGNSVLHAVLFTRPNVGERDQAECVRLLIAGGADVHAKRLNDYHGVSAPTPFDDALYYNRRWLFPIFLRAGASCAVNPYVERYPYFRKVRNAGGIKAYEKAHLKRLVAMLVHKFPQLPAAVHPNIVRHWAHVGDY